MLGSVKQALTLYYQENGEFAQDANLNDRHDALGILRKNHWTDNTDYIRRLVVYTSGNIRIVFKLDTQGVSKLIAGKNFELRPTVDPTSGAITSWTCFTRAPSNWIDEEFIKSCM